MYTDWLLIRRLARELDRPFAGARVRDAGEMPDGRLALLVWKRGTSSLITIDAFGATPMITVESGELPVHAERGFARAVGASLRGKILTGVESRGNDRVLRLQFSSRSRFGVEDAYSLVCELVPRFGNIVLIKTSGDSGVVVAAAKEFSPAENRVRSVQAGSRYEPPPLPVRSTTKLLASEQDVAAASERIDDQLYVYRRGAEIVQAHLVPLPRYADLECERAPSLLEVLAQVRKSDARLNQGDRLAKRRRELERRLSEREKKVHAQLSATAAKLEQESKTQAMRAEGESLYATLHERPHHERSEAKARAAELFAQYKKSTAAIPRLQRRAESLSAQLAEIAQLRWELERAADEDIEDVTQAILTGHPQRAGRTRAPHRKRKPLLYQTDSGSRIYVGRTPLENADLTFRVARPHDLWFHVQNQPGAHVVLLRDDKQAPPNDDILRAAALAAFHSKARGSPKVTVDFTHRKYVRKRPAAAPGLVFYTHPRSVTVAPASPDGP